MRANARRDTTPVLLQLREEREELKVLLRLIARRTPTCLRRRHTVCFLLRVQSQMHGQPWGPTEQDGEHGR